MTGIGKVTTLAAGLVLATGLLVGTSSGAPSGEIHAAAFVRNVSGTPTLPTEKAKLDGLQFYVPARTADGTTTEVEYRNAEGQLVETRGVVKPLVSVYVDGGDVVAAYSLDDGDTWAKTNLSMSAGRSSFTLANGTAAMGVVSKPALSLKSNKLMVAWTSPYCAGGAPRYESEPGDEWGVGGPQRSTDYADQGYPEVGEVPYTCLWATRGVVDQTTGALTWYRSERITSGHRYAMQIALNSAPNAGFALAWAEDPLGIRPGEGSGPGDGWTGANPNDGTDVWYSFLAMKDFEPVESPAAGDPADPAEMQARPKPLVRMSPPVPISDNRAVVTREDVPAAQADRLCATTADVPGEDGVTRTFCVTDGRQLLDGDTGGTRPALNLSPYSVTKPDGTTSYGAFAVLGYEETKGLGEQDDGETEGGTPPCGSVGKNIHHHTFDFRLPEPVTAGTILNPQMTDADGTPLFVERDGEPVLDWKGEPIPARENARRLRYLTQPKAQMGPSRTVGVAIYRMGELGQAAAADFVMQRFVVPAADTAADNPFRPDNLVAEIANVSAVTATGTWTDPETNVERVTTWTQTEANLGDRTTLLASDSGRGHRGFIKGDFLALGYLWTGNWELYLQGKDVENYYVRRSFDGGRTFTTTPAALGGTGAQSCSWFNDPVTGALLAPACVELSPGAFEPAQNLSRLDGFDETAIEPRLVGLPGTIAGSPYGEDVQDAATVWQVWGTAAPQTGGDFEPGDVELAVPGAEPADAKGPLDLWFTLSSDWGDTYARNAVLADGPSGQAEAQVRFSPDGSKMHAVWNEYGPGDLDVFFRRVVPEVRPIVPETPATPPAVGGVEAAPAAPAAVPGPFLPPATAGRATCTITGTAGPDVLRGTPRRDVICGLGGDDVLSGLGGDDLIVGGPGNDRLNGGAGADVLHGEAGDDRVDGGTGNDVLYGGVGDDVLTHTSGRDRLFAGAGNDRLYARDGAYDWVNGGAGRDRAAVDRVDRTHGVELPDRR